MAISQTILERFEAWLGEAKQRHPDTYNGMFLATANATGAPSGRVVLLKDFDGEGFVFFTNYLSRKGEELDTNPQAAATFWWSELERQVRIEGTIEKVSREESLAYFTSRPLLSRIAALVSEQSRPIESFETLEHRFSEARTGMAEEEISCPEHWGGYRLVPAAIEFWQGKSHRLHERHAFSFAHGEWRREILQP